MKTKSFSMDTADIAVDLSWVDLLRGIAIIGVFLDNWTDYMKYDTTPALLYSLAKALTPAVGPFVQVFFILSGFGLTLSYLNRKANWSWKEWAWRRITKIVVPYEIIVIFSFLLGILGSNLYQSVNLELSASSWNGVDFLWTSLLAYVTLTRNFFPPSWVWNQPLWFMPVIIGLYVCFPVLIKILEKWGPWILLLISAIVTFGTITVADLAGAPDSHGADLFSFWALQFSSGMVLAYIKSLYSQKLRNLIDLKAFFLGIGLYTFSWILRTYVPKGNVFNDIFSSVGIFLILLNLCWVSRLRIPSIGNLLMSLSDKSFLMFLVHYPIMSFLIGPPLRVPANPIVVIALGGMYIVGIFLLCNFISDPIDRFTSWLFQKSRAAYSVKAL